MAEIDRTVLNRHFNLPFQPAFWDGLPTSVHLQCKRMAIDHCASGKRMHFTREVAEDVLIEAWTRFDYTPGNGPVAVYQCEDCGQFHLTSHGPLNERLSKAISEGKIGRQKEADRWLNKMKRR